MTLTGLQDSTDPREVFHDYFSTESTAILESIESLANTSTSARQNVIDTTLGRISQLSNEVKDATNYLPTYDQKSYSEQLKSISEKLAAAKESFAPKQKFSFARKQKTIAGAAAAPLTASTSSTPVTKDLDNAAPHPPHKHEIPTNDIILSDKKNTHIINPPSSITTSIRLSSFSNCIITLPPSSSSHSTFSGLLAKDITHSLLLCNTIHGPAHITDLSHSVIVVSCRQLRLHDSVDTDVYLTCPNRPIIENCRGIRFAMYPGTERDEGNMWNQVDDFKWLSGSVKSPNWRIMGEGEGSVTWSKLKELEGTNKVEDGTVQTVLDELLPRSSSL